MERVLYKNEKGQGNRASKMNFHLCLISTSHLAILSTHHMHPSFPLTLLNSVRIYILNFSASGRFLPFDLFIYSSPGPFSRLPFIFMSQTVTETERPHKPAGDFTFTFFRLKIPHDYSFFMCVFDSRQRYVFDDRCGGDILNYVPRPLFSSLYRLCRGVWGT